MVENNKKRNTEIKEFSLEIDLGATVTVDRESWFKPSARSGIKWTSIPTESEIKAATELMTKTVIEPLIDQMVDLISSKSIGS